MARTPGCQAPTSAYLGYGHGRPACVPKSFGGSRPGTIPGRYPTRGWPPAKPGISCRETTGVATFHGSRHSSTSMVLRLGYQTRARSAARSRLSAVPEIALFPGGNCRMGSVRVQVIRPAALIRFTDSASDIGGLADLRASKELMCFSDVGAELSGIGCHAPILARGASGSLNPTSVTRCGRFGRSFTM